MLQPQCLQRPAPHSTALDYRTNELLEAYGVVASRKGEALERRVGLEVKRANPTLQQTTFI